MILHQGLHLFLSAFVPLSDVHMQRVVAAGLAISPLPPLFESCNQADTRLRHHVVDCNTNKQVGFNVHKQTAKSNHTLDVTHICNVIIPGTVLLCFYNWLKTHV